MTRRKVISLEINDNDANTSFNIGQWEMIVRPSLTALVTA